MAVHGPEEKRLSPIVAVIGFVLTAAIAFAVGYFVAKPPSIESMPDTSAELAKASVDSTLLPVKGSPARGSQTAPVTIVEFGDFQCTACRGASTGILDRVVQDYGQDNIRIIWKHLPLDMHKDAKLAAQAAWAAGQQGKFWEYHDKIFDNFPTDRNDAQAFRQQFQTFLKADQLVEYAQSLQLDPQQFKQDMNSDAARQAVEGDIELARSLGLKSTPSMFINGRRVSFSSGVSYEAVKQIVDEELSKAQSLQDSPNAYYAYSVFANSSLPDGIKTGPVAAVGAAEVADAEGAAPRPAGGNMRAGGAERAAAPTAAGAGGTGPDISTLPTKGAKNPKVTIVEFSDFQCPFCSKVNPTIDQILKEYPNDVRVAFAQFPLDFHKDAPLAGAASMAAHEQGKFWEYHDLLFANQKQLKRPDLERYAQQLGLDMNKFKAALDSGKYQKVIDQHMAQGKQFGITGTPSFLINGQKFVGAQPVDRFKTIIDAEIKRADQVAKATGLSGDALYKELVKTAPKPEAKKPAAAEKPADEGRHMVGIGQSPVLGDPNAPVTIVEFSDFQCPFCSKATNTLKQLVEANPGKVKVVFKHFPLDFHKDAPLAHRASIAAQKQGKFWEYHDVLFENVKALKEPDLIRYAQQVGLDMNKFKADLANAELDKIVQADKAAGGKVQVRGTPHFFINGTRFSGAQPLNAFQAALDRELKVANEYLKKGTPAGKLYETIIKDNKKAEAPKIEMDLKGSPSKGPANAPVTIVEFSDFQCPFCSKVNPTIDRIMKEYPNDVRVVFKQLPLDFHKDAHLAGQASLAAHEQGKFWEYHDLLFANQKALKRADLEKYAQQLGLDMNKFKAALDSGKYKKAVDNDLAQARGVGISGTPSFLINGKKFVGAQPYESFKAEIDAALQK